MKNKILKKKKTFLFATKSSFRFSFVKKIGIHMKNLIYSQNQFLHFEVYPFSLKTEFKLAATFQNRQTNNKFECNIKKN